MKQDAGSNSSSETPHHKRARPGHREHSSYAHFYASTTHARATYGTTSFDNRAHIFWERGPSTPCSKLMSAFVIAFKTRMARR